MITEGELQKRSQTESVGQPEALRRARFFLVWGLRPVFVGTDFDVRVLAERISPYTG